MKVSRAALLIAVSAMVVGPAVAAKKKAAPAPKCIKDRVLSAFQMRMLQTELVVGALSCKMTPRYNEFVIAYRPDHGGKTMMKYFGRIRQGLQVATPTGFTQPANITEFCLFLGAYDNCLGRRS
jgi:hypothetical protein